MDRTALGDEQRYIYDELVQFFWQGGLVLKDGYGSTDIYTRKGLLFCSIKYIEQLYPREKSIFVLINRTIIEKSNLKKRDHTYVAIPFASYLPQAKEKIFEAYNLYFRESGMPDKLKNRKKYRYHVRLTIGNNPTPMPPAFNAQNPNLPN